MQKDLEQLKKSALAEIDTIKKSELLQKLEKKYLGRKGELTQVLRQLKDLSDDLKPVVGKLANEVKQDIEVALQEAQLKLSGKTDLTDFDLTLPGTKVQGGHLHPLTQVIRQINQIFTSMGYEIADGPEVETANNNFDLLNIPKNHPARDAWDTFYLEDGKDINDDDKLLLRTHTSPVQIRAMEGRKPPIRLIAPGRVFRHEATDSSHEATFYQVEGLVIGRGVRVTDLTGTLDLFLKKMFGDGVKTRVRPHHYPFTEPSLDVDMSCILCSGQGCPVCSQSGWLEMLGSGMVHPDVLTKMKVDPKKYSGFAFGIGIDRIMMLKYGIKDIRLSYSGDIRFLKQF
ncbi:phenylalanine--tRNA ligase subunit alpha [Patescibacteria group bacterium]|nr:phenylalanine--tRNA ligase subunit alpha [Patescibacteria group bacterium]